MDFQLTAEQKAFQGEVNAFVDALPDAEDPGYDETLRKGLADRSWLALAWPKEYGGLGATPMQQMVFNEGMGYRRVRASSMGTMWVGPALMVYGSDEQKERWLPKIVTGEDVWCTLYSEPGAGSDLAALQTRAIKDGDEYVVSGQKIWTSGARRSNWGWLEARDDTAAPEHRRISIFCLRRGSPGITVRPLVNMTGNHEFNEVFFDNVRIPASQRIGEENRGWYTLAVALDFERSSIGSTSGARRSLDDFIGMVKTGTGRLNAETRGRLVDAVVASQVLRFIGYRIAAEQEKTGTAPTLL
ncbi:MAG TPA: acyl-CoA dehydrogenase family protein, partial [Tepidiformaceae bacterium]|nr:acyl-CoA dehydrogenase family protein [Tepidiformaceae bacterium]